MAGWFFAEGTVVLERALRSGLTPASVLVDPRRLDSVPRAITESAPVLVGSPEVLTEVGGRPRLRDAIACFVRPPQLAPETVLAGARQVLVLEGVANPNNLGVIVRGAAGLGMDALLVDPTSCDPLYRRAVRVSMGEVFAVPHARLEALPVGLGVLRGLGFRLVGLTPRADAVDLGDLRLEADERVALVLGAEGPGLTDATMDACDDLVCIPMASGVDSINVGSAAAVACYAVGAARRG